MAKTANPTTHVIHKKFGGLRTSIADPPSNTAIDCKNMVRHRRVGLLEQANGYAPRWPGETPDMPQTSDPNAANYIKPDLHEMESLVFENIHNFFCAAHGGKEVTLAIGTAKIGRNNANANTGFYEQIHFSIIGATNANPIVIQTGSPHPFQTGNTGVVVSDVQGNPAANNSNWIVTRIDGTHFSLNGSFGNGAYTGRGVCFRHNPPVQIQRAVVFARPYWNGSVWIDKWLELSEMFVFQMMQDLGANKIAIDSNYYLFDEKVIDPNNGEPDPLADVFNASYFLNWTLYCRVNNQDWTSIVTECGFDALTYYFKVFGNTSPSSIPSGTKLYLYRNWDPMFENEGNFPSAVNSFVHSLLNGVRITTGLGNSTDASLMVGSLTKSWAASLVCDLTPDRLVLQGAPPNVGASFLQSFVVDGNSLVGDTAPGYYFWRLTAVFDDEDGNVNESASLASSSCQVPSNIYGMYATITIQRGSLPLRLRKFNLYCSDMQPTNVDPGSYFFIIDLKLYLGENAWTPMVGHIGNNFLFSLAGFFDRISNAMLTVAGRTEMSANMGHAISDTGIIKYKYGAVVGRKSYYAGVLQAGKSIPNKVFTGTANGDGAISYDTFPSDGLHEIDLEYSDGDEVIGLAGLEDNVLVHKRRSIILVTPNKFTGGYDRRLVTKGSGIASARSIISFDDVILWDDYFSILGFSTRGKEIVNKAFLQDWRDLPLEVKESAIGILDRTNNQYRLSVGNSEYILDLEDGEIMVQQLNNTPTRYAVRIDGRIDFLTIVDGRQNIETIGGNILQGLNGFDFFYETNEFQHERDEDFDIVLKRVFLRYRSDVDLTLKVFKNDTQVQLGESVTVSKNNHRARWKSTPGMRCSSFRIRIEGTIAEDGQKVKIIRLGAKYEILPAGGSELTES